MTSGDETRPVPRASLFGDDPSAEETQRVDQPYPDGGQPGRRPPVQPPNRIERPDPRAVPPQGGYPPAGEGLFDGGPHQQGDGPTILANQAFDWESNLQEVEFTRSSRVGIVAVFLVALVAVIVVALGLAAWSVFGGGGDGETATDGGIDSTIDGATTVPGAETTDSTPPASETTVVDPNALRVTVIEDPFVCDGGTREFALIGGADPNESVSFTSPQASGLRSGEADVNGELPIRWQCDPDQAGTTWELTATGDVSGRSVTFLVAGVTAAGAPPPTELAVDVVENPFVCNGQTRIFAGLTGAEPNESIAFSSPQTSNLRPGQADADGALSIRWQCDPSQAGTTWELTATGETSGRSVTFDFTGR